jgi:hypothetical protein
MVVPGYSATLWEIAGDEEEGHPENGVCEPMHVEVI